MKYNADYISDISRKTGFDAVSLEKALRLKEILQELARHPFLQDKLVLKGGTAINLFLFNLPRLSVDIDLNYVGQVERDRMLEERPLVERVPLDGHPPAVVFRPAALEVLHLHGRRRLLEGHGQCLDVARLLEADLAGSGVRQREGGEVQSLCGRGV